MPILTKQINEVINIDDNIQITIMEVLENHVKIGIQAPRETSVYRKEIYKRIQKHYKPARLIKK